MRQTGKNMENVFALPTGETTPMQALLSAMEFANNDNLQDVIIVGYDGYGDLLVRCSNMSRADALWLAEHLRKHILKED